MKTIADAFNQKIARRTVFKIACGMALAIAFIPRLAFAAKNSLVAIRAATQPNGTTRLVIETSERPSYKLSHLTDPDRLVVELSNAGGTARATIAADALVRSVDVATSGDKLNITAHLRRRVPSIPRENIMILNPNGDTGFRLVLDFAAGGVGGATATAAATTTKGTTSTSSSATSASNNTKPATTATKRRKPIIVVDAGHGGKDPGAIGRSGVREKDVVLSVARKMRGKLEGAGYEVHLTRATDVFLNLDTRAGIAEKKRADLFISLHANANPSRNVQGFSIYTLSKKASDEEAQKLADAENASDKIDVDGFERFEADIRNALSALQQHAVAESSVEFAAGAARAMRNAGIKEQFNTGMRSAPFAVLRSTIPSALVELGHLSHKDEEKLLNSGAHQDKLVAALLRAINNYDFEM